MNAFLLTAILLFTFQGNLAQAQNLAYDFGKTLSLTVFDQSGNQQAGVVGLDVRRDENAFGQPIPGSSYFIAAGAAYANEHAAVVFEAGWMKNYTFAPTNETADFLCKSMGFKTGKVYASYKADLGMSIRRDVVQYNPRSRKLELVKTNSNAYLVGGSCYY